MAEIARPTSWWRNIQLTGPASADNANVAADAVAQHPNSTLDAQAARLLKARQAVLQLDIAIQQCDNVFQKTLSEIEAHYTQQVDSVEQQYRAKSGDLDQRYRSAHNILMREQGGMAEMLKGVDCRAQFVNHFPVPPPPPPPPQEPQT